MSGYGIVEAQHLKHGDAVVTCGAPLATLTVELVEKTPDGIVVKWQRGDTSSPWPPALQVLVQPAEVDRGGWCPVCKPHADRIARRERALLEVAAEKREQDTHQIGRLLIENERLKRAPAPSEENKNHG